MWLRPGSARCPAAGSITCAGVIQTAPRCASVRATEEETVMACAAAACARIYAEPVCLFVYCMHSRCLCLCNKVCDGLNSVLLNICVSEINGSYGGLHVCV